MQIDSSQKIPNQRLSRIGSLFTVIKTRLIEDVSTGTVAGNCKQVLIDAQFGTENKTIHVSFTLVQRINWFLLQF